MKYNKDEYIGKEV